MEELEFVKSMQVLELKENDILVVKLETVLSQSHVKRIKTVIKDNLPENVKGKTKVFVLEPGVDIGVLRSKNESL